MTDTALRDQHCQPLKGKQHALSADAIDTFLADLPGWQRDGDGIRKKFEFDDYHHTMAFVNAVAWIAHGEDHHPDLNIGYDRCGVYFSTHDVGGLSKNDMICAAKVDALLG
ncbi:MAG: 4a-hydroxytetrahydrobiopterin dehydratase [Dokdonella sp.]